MVKNNLDVQGTMVKMLHINNADYISITDIAKIRNPIEPKDVVKNWMRSKNTLIFLGLWGKLNNPTFNGVEFDPPYVRSWNKRFYDESDPLG